MLDEVKVSVKLNVERPAAEELYDEMEAHLLIMIEEFISLKTTSNLTISNLQLVFTPRALTEFLRDKFHQPLIDVQRVEFIRGYTDFVVHFYIKAIVSNFWAVAYGKGLLQSEDLDEAVNFLKSGTYSALSTQQNQTTINGEDVKPLIGSLCYDNLAGKMKLWDGQQWLAA